MWHVAASVPPRAGMFYSQTTPEEHTLKPSEGDGCVSVQ